jgi:hypothetical protein
MLDDDDDDDVLGKRWSGAGPGGSGGRPGGKGGRAALTGAVADDANEPAGSRSMPGNMSAAATQHARA